MDQKTPIEDYTAVLLAAGFGSRIMDLTDLPKCLLALNGKTLLERNFEIWKELGIKKVHLVLGYMREEVIAVAEKYKTSFELIYSFNEDIKTLGNTFSLYLGIKKVTGPSIIFDADLVYDLEILKDFLSSKTPDQILVGPTEIDDIECAKTLVDHRGLARKTVDKRAISQEELKEYRFAGEAIGILKFSTALNQKLTLEAEDFLNKQENQFLNWEHLLNQFLPKYEVGIHMTNSEHWIEIDTSEDYREAQTLFEG